ncbi:PREDICTED: STOREKEEPER protein-like [Nicotiana attenuata]|uniref:STOREKEEPER protein-like n=1 Tax=Nicotiana attenuata TaxID=49451 RepID=UPI000905C546|nr:PREDICTED: STOREKEEPER protein-like [Nicotiana attenuata]
MAGNARPQEETQTDDEQSKKLKSSCDFPWRKPPPKWGDEDLITLLKGLIEFKSSEYAKRRPYVDMYSFYYFIAEKLQVKVDRFRMNDKLSKKLWGDDYLVYEFSKKIYGGKISGGIINRLVKNVNSERDQVNDTFTKLKEVEKEIVVKEVAASGEIDDQDQLNFQFKYPHLAATFNVMKKNMSSVGSDTMRNLEEKLKKLQEKETDLKIKRLDLIRENCKLVAGQREEHKNLVVGTIIYANVFPFCYWNINPASF